MSTQTAIAPINDPSPCVAPLPPFAASSGPHDAQVVVVGEAWGEQEAKIGRPFIGPSGQELTRLLAEAGFKRSDLLLTNVLAFQPPGNKIENLCCTKKEAGEGYPFPAISHGKYLRPQFLPEISRLREEISAFPRHLVVALGNTACWALLGSSGISSLRGVTANSTLCPGTKVLPTYHPAAILRQWAWRPIALADLLKAKRESAFPHILRPERYVLVEPTLAEIEDWIKTHAISAPYLSVDIETRLGQITEIGFAASRKHALVIPFVKGFNSDFWQNEGEEYQAWDFVEQLLTLPCAKIFQNGLYDLTYLARLGLRVCTASEDTMLLHHSLYPEMQKSLAFLGSVYTGESSWKLTYRKARKEELKSDE